jgi:hypothetical protein
MTSAGKFEQQDSDVTHLCTLKKGGCKIALGIKMAFVSRL